MWHIILVWCAVITYINRSRKEYGSPCTSEGKLYFWKFDWNIQGVEEWEKRYFREKVILLSRRLWPLSEELLLIICWRDYSYFLYCPGIVGEAFTVRVCYAVIPSGSDQEVRTKNSLTSSFSYRFPHSFFMVRIGYILICKTMYI